MNNLKNLAGNEVAIFLFRFELHGNNIGFVLNEAIAADMYPEIDEKLKPLIAVCGETLLRYRHLSVSNTIMDGNILNTGEFEVMLSRGLGRHFIEAEKQALFQDAKSIFDLLDEVMRRRTQEEKQGIHHDPFPVTYPQAPTNLQKGREQLGEEKRLHAELQWMIDGKHVRPGLHRLRAEDLPPSVTTTRGYDHRGHCYVFTHKTLGELGRIVMTEMGEKTVLQAEIHTGQEPMDSPLMKRKKKIFEQIVKTVDTCFEENFPEE
jgi:hypothetical protein